MLGPSEAEDAAQEAVIRAWRATDRCTGSDRRAWMRTIARREALRLVASRRNHCELLDEEAVEGRDHGLRLDVVAAVGGLSPAEQVTVLARYWADQSEQEIADMLGEPVGTVKVRLHRARSKLALKLVPPLECTAVGA